MPGAMPSMTALQMPTESSFTSKSVRKPMTRAGTGCCAAVIPANAAIAAPRRNFIVLRIRASQSFSHGNAQTPLTRAAANVRLDQEQD